MPSPAHIPTAVPEPPLEHASNERKPCCPFCGGVVECPPTGRPRRWCSPGCRAQAHREIARLQNELRELARQVTLARAQRNEAMQEHREARIAAAEVRLAELTGW